MLKKIFIYIMFLLNLSVTTVVTKVDSEAILTSVSKGAILIEPSTMTVLYEYQPYEKLIPASLTKVMTMLLVCEAIENNIINLDDELVTSEYAASMGGTNIYLEENEKMSVRDLLKSVAIASANDASIVLAEGISGTVDNFVKKMNEKGKELGLTNTVFKNPNGLPEDGHYTCSMDMAIVSCYLVNNYPFILEYTSKYEDYVREDTTKKFWLVNRNKLVKFVEGVDGLKTGWTQEAGYCLIATQNKNGLRLVSVVMGASTPEARLKESMQMLNYGMSNYEKVVIYKKGDTIASYVDINITPKTFNVYVKEEVSIIKRKNEELKDVKIEKQIDYTNLKDIGKMKVYYDGNEYKVVKLGIIEEIKKASFFEVLYEVIKEVFLVSD